ncbi:hypothetical protein [Sphingobacterium multivorum]|uniref:hypothetical protein n=1 Tax=Sphingobacterium multivorum TaxID=28454 RepID=UPI00155918C8|nr:hypothetical protein [Sphingobacterium multivorum]
MKKLKSILCSMLAMSALLSGCIKDNVNESIGTLNPEISLYALRSLYKNADLQLNASSLQGAEHIKVVVVSHAENKNLPEKYTCCTEYLAKSTPWNISSGTQCV